MASPRKTPWYMHAVTDPTGVVLRYTLDDYKESAWSNGGFDHAANAFGESWRSRYWHKLTPSMKAAVKRGYSLKKFKLVEVKE